MYTFLLLTVLLSVSLSGVSACTCAIESIQEKFCRADIAVRGTVTNKITIGNNIRVFISVDYSFNDVRGKDIIVETADNSAACGVNFTVGTKYLITANNKKGRKRYQGKRVYETNSCLWNIEWNAIDRETQQALENGTFQRGCGGYKPRKQ